MAKPDKALNRLLKQTGAELVRSKKHLVYRLPNGKTFVLSKSASDHRSAANARKTLERLAAEEVVAKQTKKKGKRRK